MSNSCKVKICGTTTASDAQMAAEAGADFSGLVVEVPFSERSVAIEQATEIVRDTPIPSVMLVFNRPVEWVEQAVARIQPFAVQLLGQETPDDVARLKQSLTCRVWNSLFLPVDRNQTVDLKPILSDIDAHIQAGVDALLFDTVDLSDGKARFGGTGKASNWNLAAQLIQACTVPAFLSGGIRAENVSVAIEEVRPYGVDLCSGVESAKGVRDSAKLTRLMEQVRSAHSNCRLQIAD